ncbi:hypothetical protein OG871_40045 (plasmid) [Kitasatospora sp. NBC_00374]|uniref:hypothetical protein n=1 Tax=Kitasatospora sp. NBC_00374 TaxID=2975964 RepID=UPI002F909A03
MPQVFYRLIMVFFLATALIAGGTAMDLSPLVTFAAGGLGLLGVIGFSARQYLRGENPAE